METKTGETRVAKAKRRRYDMIRRRKEKNKREGERRKKLKETKMMDVKKVAEEWEIWNEKEKLAKSEKKAKKLVLQWFYK